MSRGLPLQDVETDNRSINDSVGNLSGGGGTGSNVQSISHTPPSQLSGILRKEGSVSSNSQTRNLSFNDVLESEVHSLGGSGPFLEMVSLGLSFIVTMCCSGWHQD